MIVLCMIYLFYLIQQNNLKSFYSYLNSRHLNISLTIKNEKDNRMSFLDINIIREKDKQFKDMFHHVDRHANELVFIRFKENSCCAE